jgi:hypothetical protein
VGASAGAAGVAPTALTGASHLGLATGTALAFSRDDDPDDCRFRVLGLNLAAHSELDYCILAAAMWVQE